MNHVAFYFLSCTFHAAYQLLKVKHVNLRSVCECILVAELFFCQFYEAITHEI